MKTSLWRLSSLPLAVLLLAAAGCASPRTGIASLQVGMPVRPEVETQLRNKEIPPIPAPEITAFSVKDADPSDPDLNGSGDAGTAGKADSRRNARASGSAGDVTGLTVYGRDFPAPPPSVDATGRDLPPRVLLAVNDGLPEGSPGTLKRALRSRVEGALAKKGCKVVDAAPSEVLAAVDLRAERVNGRGSRVVWSGDADVRVSRAPGLGGGDASRTLSREWRDVKGTEARSDDAAQKELAELLAADLPAFVAESATDAAGRLRVKELVVRNAWRHPNEAAAYAARFARGVERLAGIYRCAVLETRPAERTMRVEIAYDEDQVAEGPANRIASQRSLGFGGKGAGDLRLADVTVENGWVRPGDSGIYATRFVETLCKLDGVFRAKVLATDPQARALRTEILFDAEKVPEGLENRIRTQDSLGFGGRTVHRPQVAEVTVRNAWARPGDAPEYAARFTDTVAKLPGVSLCRLLSTDAEGRILRAEVVYDREKVPEGLENRIRRQAPLGFGPKEPDGLRVALVTVTDGWKGKDPVAAAAYAARFAEVAGGMPGAFGCRILRTDAAEGTLQAEITYDEAAMPEGIENRLLRQPGLGFRKGER